MGGLLGHDDLLQATLRLVLAWLLGGIVGWQREAHDRPAGFRTHILVCLGSCLVMLVSLGIAGGRSDPGRVAAQVVSGIGFLGAGAILRQGNVVRGLTTAASLWIVAAIGLAAGMGGNFAVLAAIATAMVMVTLTLLRRLERQMIARGQFRHIEIEVAREEVGTVLRILSARDVAVSSIDSEPAAQEGFQRVQAFVRVPSDVRLEDLTQALYAVPGVREVDWD